MYLHIYAIIMTIIYHSRSAFESFLEDMEVHVSRKSWNQMFKKIDRYVRERDLNPRPSSPLYSTLLL